jgi:hypothetical protein
MLTGLIWTSFIGTLLMLPLVGSAAWSPLVGTVGGPVVWHVALRRWWVWARDVPEALHLELQARATELQRQLDETRAFTVRTSRQSCSVWSPEQTGGWQWWLLAWNITLTNRTDHAIPLQLSLSISRDAEGTQTVGNACQEQAPASVKKAMATDGLGPQLGRYLRLSPKDAVTGYCATWVYPNDLRRTVGVEKGHIWSHRAMWLRVRNCLDDTEQAYPLNDVAEAVLAKRRAAAWDETPVR